jgi:hypothetical protein
MSNHAYASVWCRGFTEETMLDLFGSLLDTVPVSAERPGFTVLIVRAVEPNEIPIIEHDLRSQPAAPEEIIELARQSAHSDSAYQTAADWDLWVRDTTAAAPLWKLQPIPLEIACHGEGYDEGVFQQAGHFLIDLGLEHLFTGHAGLLGFEGRAVAAPQHPVEAEFLREMREPAQLAAYREKTRENIHKLTKWLEQIREALPVERYALWSEGEENFEARLDEILAAR